MDVIPSDYFDTPADGSIPKFLRRDLNKMASGGSALASSSLVWGKPLSPAEEFRAKHPLTERDQTIIDALERRGQQQPVQKDEGGEAIVAVSSYVEVAPEPKPEKKASPGIIATVMKAMQRKQGASQQEMVEQLVGIFPERDAKGMMSTVKIQSKKRSTSTREIKGRGTVYYMKVVEG